MHIRTKGIPDNVSRSMCKEALRFYGEQLLSKRLLNNISVYLVFEKLPPGFAALCLWEDDNLICRSFVIQINHKLNKKATLVALAHEMIHVKQYAKRQLKDYLRTDKVKWGKRFYMLENVDYWDTPWEKEAHKKDKILYESFKNRNK